MNSRTDPPAPGGANAASGGVNAVSGGGGAASAPENHWDAGRRGEDHALAFLSSQGFRLLHRNYRHGRGEIDLVMEDPAGVLVFIEVKANRAASAGRPLERIDGRKIARLQRLAQRYCWRFGQEDRDMRFDVVGVELPPGGAAPRLEHIAGAFLPDGANYYPAR
ncbi:MAG TPA: YraN family protein [Fibrobacteria bacterium]|nr:YraN family protein [Fibrobacteria bacterium]